MRILLVEDDQDLASTIQDYLSLESHAVDYAHDGVVALHLATELEFDAVILDVAMPRMDGLEFCKRLRVQGKGTPVLMLTARNTLEDKLLGFESGTDDYLTKPFALEELAARLRALSTRGPRSDVGVRAVGDLQIDFERQAVSRSGKALKLNRVQFALLKALALASPGLVSRESLEYSIWGDEVPESDALRTHVYRLRNIVDRGFETPLIHTAHGKGFRLAVD
ncbi:MAG: response regulator transcription factor [Myxococcota bacterium]